MFAHADQCATSMLPYNTNCVLQISMHFRDSSWHIDIHAALPQLICSIWAQEVFHRSMQKINGASFSRDVRMQSSMRQTHRTQSYTIARTAWITSIPNQQCRSLTGALTGRFLAIGIHQKIEGAHGIQLWKHQRKKKHEFSGKFVGGFLGKFMREYIRHSLGNP